MPYHTLIIKDQYSHRLRQFSGTRLAVQVEYDLFCPIKWNYCTAIWRTRTGRVIEKKVFPSLKKEKSKSSKNSKNTKKQ